MSDLRKWLGRVFKLHEGQLVIGPIPQPVVLDFEQGCEMLHAVTEKVGKCRPTEQPQGSAGVECAIRLWNQGHPSPRTCGLCSLGPCKYGEVRSPL